jgi:hypothetical protein
MWGKMTRRGLLLLTVLLAAAALTVLGLGRGRQDGQRPADAAAQETFDEAVRREGLRGAARVRGTYVHQYDYHFLEVGTDWEGLTKKSELIVTGVARDNRCRLTKDGFIVLTVYEVLVQEVIKGEGVEAGDIIKVALPGGKVKFEDGTTAETVTPDFEKMRNGNRYALYLNKRPPGDGDVYKDSNIVVYSLSTGPQGLFELTPEGTVKPHAHPDKPLVKETKDKHVTAFLTEARALAEKYPRPGKCCK